MNPGFVSLHTYFKVHPGKLDAIKQCCRSSRPRPPQRRLCSSTNSAGTDGKTIYFTNCVEKERTARSSWCVPRRTGSIARVGRQELTRAFACGADGCFVFPWTMM